jgi:hypothetical protein
MKYPNDSEIETAKKSAATKGTTAELLTFDDLEVCVIAYAFTSATWSIYLDAQQRNVSDAKDSAFADHVAWPPSAEADALAERIPALSSLVVGELSELAGSIDAMPKTCKLTATTPPSELARAGLSSDKAAALLMQYNHPGQLTIARFPTLDISTPGKGFAVVVKVPSKPVYRARLEVYHKAKTEGAGVFDCAAQAARDFIVWTSEGDNPDPIFAARPGVVADDLISLFVRVGGANAKGERRRL